MELEESVVLPGFRFHPTEEELLNFYLKTMVFGNKLRARQCNIIGFLNIYNHHPTELPGLAKIGEREWYFFVPRDKKHGTGGGRPNRTTQNGFWKATGSDRKILTPKKMLGLRKTLVFYEGRAPRGRKTDWVMNEYRLPDTHTHTHTDTCSPHPNPNPKDIVLCKIYMKATSLKMLEQRAAIEEEVHTHGSPLLLTPPMDSISFCNQFEEVNATISERNIMEFKKENEGIILVEEKYCESFEESSKRRTCTSLALPNGKENLAELQMPKFNSQDSFWTQLRSSWLENFTPF